MDGCFVHTTRRRAPRARHLRASARPGRLQRGRDRGPAAGALERPDGTPLFSPVLAGGQAAGLYSLVGREELLELGWRARALANELSAPRHDRRRTQLHGQEGGRAGAGADRRLPRAQGRESVPHPRLPHRRARGRQLSRPTCARASTTAAWPRPRASGPPRCRSWPRSSPPAGRACSRSCASRSRPAWSRCSRSPGLGVAKIRQIHDVLDIDSLPELEAAALDGRLARLPRFGPKTVREHPQGHRLPSPGQRLPAAAPRGGRGGRTARGARADAGRAPGRRRGRRAPPAPRWCGTWCW